MKWSDKEPKIIFSDNQILIASKPAGFLTQPDDTDSPSLEAFAKAWVKKEYKKPGSVFLHALHRLDRPVAGLVLFARTSKALSRLNEASRKQEIERIYLCEVEGELGLNKGRLEHFLVHGDHQAIVHKDGKLAVLHYEVIEKCLKTSKVRVRLETGRYHQIRAQFAAIGHPIVGDARYGAKQTNDGCIHLICQELSFHHPVSGARVTFNFSAI